MEEITRAEDQMSPAGTDRQEGQTKETRGIGSPESKVSSGIALSSQTAEQSKM